jgi:hypothetical protein
MFTNEFFSDETVTTVMDDRGNHEDVHVFIDGNEVFIRQWNENIARYDLINMSHSMWFEAQQAMKTTEGVFRIEYNT